MSAPKLAWLVTLAFVSFLLIPACAEDPAAPESWGIPAFTLAELENAPEIIDLPHQDYRLKTYVWRDFMPISPPGGKAMIASIHVISVDGEPIPSTVKPRFLWVIDDGRVWSALLPEVYDTPGDDRVQGIARNGPKWETGIQVDVVVGVEAGSHLRLLKARDQLIHATH